MLIKPSKNHKTTSRALLNAAAISIFLCTSAIADSAPKHITIGATKHLGITITNGAAPIAKTLPAIKNPTPKDIKTPPKPRKLVQIVPKTIKTIQCHDVGGTHQNSDLKNALKLYITAKNRDPALIDNIYSAANTAKINVELLLIKAMIESDLGRITVSKTSTARGVFQYIEPTWLVLMKRYGAIIGYEQQANAITINAQTLNPEVKEGSAFNREEILDLRYNAHISALIKSYQIRDESKSLAFYKNSDNINATDHYIAHMLGLPRARSFYEHLGTNSGIILATSKTDPFTQAAKFNPAFFYDHKGNALSANGAYQKFHDKVSARYDQLRDIQSRFGNGIETKNSGCNLPQVRTVRTL